MAQHRRTRVSTGRGRQDADRVETEIEEDVGGAAAAGAAEQVAGAAAGGLATQALADVVNQLRQQMNNITETVGKVVEQKIDVGEQEAQGAGIVQGTDASRNLQNLVAHNAAVLSNHAHNETARFASILQSTTVLAASAMQVLLTAVAATAANDETQQRSANADIRGGHRHTP